MTRPRPAAPWEVNLTKVIPLQVFARALKEKFLPGPGPSRRERVTRAIEFQGPDRIPHQRRDFWFLFHVPPPSWQPPEPYYPYVHPGIIQTRAWRWSRRRDIRWLQEDRLSIDEFGTTWKASGRTSLGEVVKGPLEDGWHLLDNYRPPDFSDWSRFQASARLGKWLDGDRYRLGVDVNSIGERWRFLRGFENAMTDLVLHPQETEHLLNMLTGLTLDVVDNFHRAGAHGFMLVDDWGTQLFSFISPRHFERFFQPCYARVAERCHEHGMHCGLHSCGDIRNLVPAMIDAGLDFLQLDSPDMCGLDWLATNAAGKICLFCSVNIQSVFPGNDPRQIRDYVREMIEKLGNHQGGLVAWPYSEPWVIDVGLRAMRLEERTFIELGAYPLDWID